MSPAFILVVGFESRRFVNACEVFIGCGAATLHHLARDGKFLDTLL